MKEIELTKGKVSRVSDEDFEELNRRYWQYVNGYAMGQIGKDPNRKRVMMHRVIMDAPAGMEVDHLDGDKLNNQRSNLRIVTKQDNLRGRRKSWGNVKYKGVISIPKYPGVYFALIRVRCASAEEAARMYDTFAKIAYGEHAAVNFPEEK